jgi:hypothetical protein
VDTTTAHRRLLHNPTKIHPSVAKYKDWTVQLHGSSDPGQAKYGKHAGDQL